MEPNQFVASVLTVLIAACVSGVIVFERGPARRWAYGVLALCAVLAMASWIKFGSFHSVYVDADDQSASPLRKKVERHQPFHFHEFFHYYIGAKYFREVGYEGLYDCAALADRQLASDDHVAPRMDGYVRDLDDVLTDKTYEAALAHCRTELFPRFTASRWASFLGDLRSLRRLVPDDWWRSAVFDAGFNPPPTWILVGSALANVIPIHLGAAPTYLVATSLDFVLLVVCFLAVRSAFGATAAAAAALYFGSSFISHFGWNGGAFLRFTWLTSLVLALWATKRRRWALAGAMFGASACDRLFPAGFAVFAVAPVAWRFLRSRSPDDRRALQRFGVGFGGTVVALVLVSWLVFGTEAWRVFVSRITRHGDIYFVMHIGLKKVVTFRDWVYAKNFHAHDGMARFRAWNLALRATWASMRALTVPIQLLAVAGTLVASRRRAPYEAALLGGAVFMFAFNLPANYYYCFLALVPALLLRSAAVARTKHQRYADYVALTAFNAFWMLTIISPKLSGDDIVYNYYICVAFAAFLVVWILAWIEPEWGLVQAAGTRLERAVSGGSSSAETERAVRSRHGRLP